MAKHYGIRDFSPALVQRIAEIIACHPGMKRTPLSRVICEALDWRGTDGRLCEMACRVTLLRLHADALVATVRCRTPRCLPRFLLFYQPGRQKLLHSSDEQQRVHKFL